MQVKTAFILASTDDAPMILNRLDYRNDKEFSTGIGIELLDRGSRGHDQIEMMFEIMLDCRARRGDGVTVLDVGANIGTHTIPWARSMSGWGQVLAIEPQERIFYALCGNIALNNCFNARALWAAAGDVTGEMSIPELNHQQPANFGGLTLTDDLGPNSCGQTVKHLTMVPALRLDDLDLRRLDFLKIDAEGMEPQILDGAKDLIRNCRPIMLVEIMMCGAEPIKQRLPGYRFVPSGIDMLAAHENDPIWSKLKLVEVDR